MERKKRIQEKIAEFRLIRFQKEQEKIKAQQEEAENERMKLLKQQESRQRYMNSQRAKLAEYQISRASRLSEFTLLQMDAQRKQAAMAAKKRAGRQYEAQKQLAAWRDEKRKAEEMLLMQPLSSQNMQEEPDYDETSALNDADIARVNRTTGEIGADVDTLEQSKFEQSKFEQSKFTQEESKKNTTVKTSVYAANQAKMDRA